MKSATQIRSKAGRIPPVAPTGAVRHRPGSCCSDQVSDFVTPSAAANSSGPERTRYSSRTRPLKITSPPRGRRSCQHDQRPHNEDKPRNHNVKQVDRRLISMSPQPKSRIVGDPFIKQMCQHRRRRTASTFTRILEFPSTMAGPPPESTSVSIGAGQSDGAPRQHVSLAGFPPAECTCRVESLDHVDRHARYGQRRQIPVSMSSNCAEKPSRSGRTHAVHVAGIVVTLRKFRS